MQLPLLQQLRSRVSNSGRGNHVPGTQRPRGTLSAVPPERGLRPLRVFAVVRSLLATANRNSPEQTLYL